MTPPMMDPMALGDDVRCGSPFGRWLLEQCQNGGCNPVLLHHYLFWCDVEELRTQSAPNNFSIDALARLIHVNYVVEGAPYEIEFDRPTRQALKQTLKRPTIDMYAAAMPSALAAIAPSLRRYHTTLATAFEAAATHDRPFRERHRLMIELAQAPAAALSDEQKQKRALKQFLNDLFHELVHELSQTSLYRVLAAEVIWEFEEGMEEVLGGEQLLLAAIKLSLKGDASEVFHMRKWLSHGTATAPPTTQQALSDYLFWSDCQAMTVMLREDATDAAIMRRCKGILRRYHAEQSLGIPVEAILEGSAVHSEAMAALQNGQTNALHRILKNWVPEFMATEEYKARQRKRRKSKAKSSAGSTRCSVATLSLAKSLAGPRDLQAFYALVIDTRRVRPFRLYLLHRASFDDPADRTTILNDLRFFIEVQRFKLLAHQHHRSDVLVYDKAKAMLHSFLDSPIPPAVQIGVPVETARAIKLKSTTKRCHVPLYFFRPVEALSFSNIHAHYCAFVVEQANVAAQVSCGERLSDNKIESVQRLFTGQWHGSRTSRRRGTAATRGMARSLSLPNLIRGPSKNRGGGGANVGMGAMGGGGGGDGTAGGGCRRPSRDSDPRPMEFLATFEISVEGGVQSSRQELMSRIGDKKAPKAEKNGDGADCGAEQRNGASRGPSGGASLKKSPSRAGRKPEWSLDE